jgi:hypothetical protein
MALRLFETKVIQEAFESEVVSALQRATDAENGGRHTLTSAFVACLFTTESVRCEDEGPQMRPTHIRATDAVRVERQTRLVVNRRGPECSEVVDSVRRVRC